MLVFLPLAAYLAIFWLLRLHGEKWRAAALGAATCWGVFVALITEILSVHRFITRPALSVSWLSLTLASLVYGLRLRGRRLEKPSGTEGEVQTAAICLTS